MFFSLLKEVRFRSNYSVKDCIERDISKFISKYYRIFVKVVKVVI